MTPLPTDVTSDVLRTVVDTNVVVSAALFPERTPGMAFKRARQRGVVLLSLPLAEELRRVFQRAKFDRYVAPALRDEFLATLIDGAKLVAVTSAVTVCRDPKDNMVLEAALDGQATCVLSGDDDLLTLDTFRGIPMLNPAVFLARFGDSST